jgi:hypothetical protein
MELLEQMPLSFRWEHPMKLRYYHVVLAQDLFGDWVVTKAWGGISKASGRIIHLPCQTYTEAKIVVEKIAKIREKRGYSLVKHTHQRIDYD